MNTYTIISKLVDKGLRNLDNLGDSDREEIIISFLKEIQEPYVLSSLIIKLIKDPTYKPVIFWQDFFYNYRSSLDKILHEALEDKKKEEIDPLKFLEENSYYEHPDQEHIIADNRERLEDFRNTRW